MAEPSTALTLLTGAIQSFSIATTALKPPPPDFRPEPLVVYLEDLKLNAPELETIPTEVQENWRDHIYHTRNGLARMISPSSLAGQAISYATPHVRQLEERAKSKALDFYQQEVDDTDRESLSQVWRFSTWAWRRIGSYVTHNLMEGAFLGYNDQMRFDLATRFSYLRMMHHATKADAYRELAFHKSTLFFVRNRIPEIAQATQLQSSKQQLWRYRWLTAEKVSILDVSLTMQLALYSQISQNQDDKTPTEYRYQAILNYHRINMMLAELRASYFNHMIEIKPKSWWSPYIQRSVDFLTDNISRLDSTETKEPRHFLDVYKDALNLNWEVYDQLFPHCKTTKHPEKALEDFVAAISEDNFILAKWITLSTETPGSNFNWMREASEFENYKRAVDRLIHIQNQIDDIITHLYSINDVLFRQFLNENKTKFDYREISQHIYRLWDLRNRVDELRIYYRTAYIKSLKTTVNETDKSYWDRITQSAKNKALRKILEGQFFDASETREQVLTRLEQFKHEYAEALKAIQSFSLPESISAIPASLLSLVDRGAEFYPVIYTFEEYYRIFESKQTVSALDIQYAVYNLNRIVRISPSSFWQAQQDEITKLAYVTKELKKAMMLADIYEQHTGNTIFKGIRTEITKAAQTLGPSYLKYIRSEWHRLHPLDASRVFTSVGNKAVRLLTQGHITDTTKEFREIYPELIKFIDDIAQLLLKNAGIIEAQQTEIKIGNITVRIPEKKRSSSQKSARDQRKEKRSTSLLILEASITDDYNPESTT